MSLRFFKCKINYGYVVKSQNNDVEREKSQVYQKTTNIEGNFFYRQKERIIIISKAKAH